MDVEDFTREVKPHHRRSRLEKFKAEISALKSKGYSDMQVRDWLAQNGITVSRENVRKFIKRHLKNLDNAPALEQPSETPATPEAIQGAQLATETSAPADSGAVESQAARLQRLAREQRNEAAQTQFKHDKTGNNH